jgi:hypothetical protein
VNVGELKEALKGVADCVPVVTPGSDHSYDCVSDASDSVAGFVHECYYEWHGAEHAVPGERAVRVLVIE